MMVTSEPPASRICDAIWPKRENPIIRTSEPAPAKSSSISSSVVSRISRLASHAASGVSAMEMVTMATSSEAVDWEKTPAAAAALKMTNPNSPPCGNNPAIWMLGL